MNGIALGGGNRDHVSQPTRLAYLILINMSRDFPSLARAPLGVLTERECTVVVLA